MTNMVQLLGSGAADALDLFTDPARRTVLAFYIDQRAIGSGVLVEIAGRSFALTAGHNLHERDTGSEVYRQLPRERLRLAPQPGRILVPLVEGAGVARLFDSVDPDVGAVELDPEFRYLWRDCEHVALDDFIPCEAIRGLDVLLLCGFPGEWSSVVNVPGSPRANFFHEVGREVKISVLQTAVGIGVRSLFEPEGGRGVSVLVRGAGFDPDARKTVEAPHPAGMSGGPLLVFRDGRRHLAGLTRALHDGQWGWCEPASEALRLLLDHDSPEVVSAVKATLERLQGP